MQEGEISTLYKVDTFVWLIWFRVIWGDTVKYSRYWLGLLKRLPRSVIVFEIWFFIDWIIIFSKFFRIFLNKFIMKICIWKKSRNWKSCFSLKHIFSHLSFEILINICMEIQKRRNPTSAVNFSNKLYSIYSNKKGFEAFYYYSWSSVSTMLGIELYDT